MRLAERADLRALAQNWLTVPTDKGANAGARITSLLGSFLRAFRFGLIRQLDAVASRFLNSLSVDAPLLVPDVGDGYVFLDIDDTIIKVHG